MPNVASGGGCNEDYVGYLHWNDPRVE